MDHNTPAAKPESGSLQIACEPPDKWGKSHAVAKIDGKIIHRDVGDWRSQYRRKQFAEAVLAATSGTSRVPTDEDDANWTPDGPAEPTGTGELEAALWDAAERAARASVNGKSRPSVELLDQPPPRNLDAERAVIGCILLDPLTAATVRDVIGWKDFTDERHRAVFRLIEQACLDASPLDHVTLLPLMRQQPAFSDGQATAYYADVARAVPSAANAGYYARQVQEASQRRRLWESSLATLQDLANDKPTGEVLCDLQSDLSDYVRGSTSGIDYKVLTSAELDAADFPIVYAIQRMLVLGQPCIMAGGKKCLKTTLLIAVAIALASRQRLFDSLEVYRQCRVLMMSGESGLATIQETFRRIARAQGIDPAGLDHLLWSDTLPKFGNTLHIEAFRRLIVEHGVEVVIIDPAYLCMGDGADAGNLFAQGKLLAQMNEVCQENGVTLIIAHHTRKGGKADPFAPPELEDIAWAGFQEWARQWILVGRREPYQPGTGEHRLWLSTGGSAGHSALWGLDVSEGTSDGSEGRKWEVELLRADEVRQDASDREAQAKSKAHDEKIETNKRRILDAIVKLPDHRGTQTDIRARSGLSGNTFSLPWAALLNDGDVIEDGEITKGNKRTYTAYALPKEGQQDNGTEQRDNGCPGA